MGGQKNAASYKFKPRVTFIGWYFVVRVMSELIGVGSVVCFRVTRCLVCGVVH